MQKRKNPTGEKVEITKYIGKMRYCVVKAYKRDTVSNWKNFVENESKKLKESREWVYDTFRGLTLLQLIEPKRTEKENI